MEERNESRPRTAINHLAPLDSKALTGPEDGNTPLFKPLTGLKLEQLAKSREES